MLAEICITINSEDLKCSWFFEVFYLGIERSQILKDVMNIHAYVYTVGQINSALFYSRKIMITFYILWLLEFN